jgi:hypothetical protein
MLSPLSTLSTGLSGQIALGRLGKSVHLPSCSRARPSGNGETLSATAPRKAAQVFGRKPAEARSRATGRKKREAAAQAKAEPTFLRGSGETGSPRAEGFAKGHRRSFASSESDREPILRSRKAQKERIPPGNRSPAARQGAGPAGTGAGIAIFRRKEPEGPTGAARPRPEPPWESELRFRARRTEPGTVEAGSDAGLHFVWGWSGVHRPCWREAGYRRSAG